MKATNIPCIVSMALFVAFGFSAQSQTAAVAISRTDTALAPHYAQAMIATPPSQLGVDTFYKKYADAFGIPIVSSAKVPDDALLMARDIVNYMLMKRMDVRTTLINHKARVLVMAQT